ncbi:hypothetical protein D3C83_02360 [compost metagenome]
MSSSAGMASARSIFATVSALPPALRIRSRAQRMSSPERGNETPRKSALSFAAVLMSCLSFSVSAGAVRPPPLRLMPLLLESGPPCSTTHRMREPFTDETPSTMRPSSSSSVSPVRTSFGSFL